MMPILRAIKRPITQWAIQGHATHAMVGYLWLQYAPFETPLHVRVSMLVVFSIGWELWDHDFRDWFWNGLADTISYWPVGVLLYSWQWASALAVAYLLALYFEGRRYAV